MKFNFFHKQELKLLWPFYVFTFMSGFVMVVMPFLVIYYQGRGFSLFEISILWSVMALVRLISEVPTGVIADVFGRKVSAVSGFFLTSFLWIFVPFVSYSYWALLILMVLLAISQTLITGALDAWVYDWLKHNKQKKLISNYYTKRPALALSGFIIGPFIGGLLVTFVKIDWLFFIEGIGGSLLCLILLLFAKEHFKRKKYNTKQKFHQMVQTTKKGFSFIFSENKFKLMLVASVSFAGWIAVNELASQPFLKDLGMPISYLGFFFSILGIFTAFAPFLGNLLAKKIGEKSVFILSALGIFLLSLLVIFTKQPYYSVGATLLILMWIAFFVQQPAFRTHIQHLLPSKTRATILSAESMLESVVYAAIMVSSGFIMTIFSPKVGLVIAGLFMIPAILSFTFIKEKK